MKKYTFPFILCVLFVESMNLLFGTVCYSILLFGLPCPFCGITRAAKLMLQGKFKASFDMHPLLILVIFGVLLYIIINILLKKSMVIIKKYVTICIIIFLLFYIYRMKSYFPYKEPMVYQENNLLSYIIEELSIKN